MPELSRSQIDKLGRRLRRAGVGGLSDADRHLLEELIASHGPVLAAVQERLSEELGLQVTSRTKTTGTLVEKLQRNRGMALSRMQDIAGVRLVMEMNRSEQDELVDVIVELFPGADRTDRREEPSHGYRAVHVVVEMDQRFVEIQVRTVLQDLWAQMIERLADRWGRGIRYGEPPNDPDAEVAEGTTRRELFEALMIQAERIHLLEIGAVKIADFESASEAISSIPEELPQELPEELQRFQRLKERLRELEEEVREFYRSAGLLK